jgi:hypothetical protein
MAAKLKSILRQIHWSLLLKAAIFALAWFFLPFWLFLLVALYLYFIPFFQSRQLFWPFFVLLVLTFIEPPVLPFFFIFALLFYFLLLLKNLLLIDRKSAYELLVIALSFFLIRSFYESFGANVITGASIWHGFLLAAFIGLLVASFLRYFSDTKNRSRRVAGWLTFILIWQFLILGLFLPLDFVYQSVIIFLVSVAIIDLIPEHYFEPAGISEQRIAVSGITIGALLLIVLLSAQWKL